MCWKTGTQEAESIAEPGRTGLGEDRDTNAHHIVLL